MSNWQTELDLLHNNQDQISVAELLCYHSFAPLLQASMSQQEINISAGADRTDDQYKWLNDYLATGWDFWLTHSLARSLLEPRPDSGVWQQQHTQTQLFGAVGNSPNISSTEAKKALFSSQIIIILVFSVETDFINCENVC